MEKKSWTDADGWTVAVEPSSLGEGYVIYTSMGGRSAGRSSVTASHEIARVGRPHLEPLRKLGKDPANYRVVAGVLVRNAALPFIESVLAELIAERDNAAATLRANVPGLDELRAAMDDQGRYDEQFEAMMEDENNDGARPPKRVRVDGAALEKQYPVAAAYAKAESWEEASNYAKVAAGKRAKSRIAAGEPYEQVLADMQAEWSAHVEQHVWD